MVCLRSVKDLENRSKTMMDLHDKIANHKAHFDAHKNLSPHDPISFASWLQEMYN